MGKTDAKNFTMKKKGIVTILIITILVIILSLIFPVLFHYCILWMDIGWIKLINKDLSIRFGELDYLSYVGAIWSAIISSAITGCVTYYVLYKTLQHGTQNYFISKKNESVELNRKSRSKNMAYVLNVLRQLQSTFNAELIGQQKLNVIPYLPNSFSIPMETLIKNVNYLAFASEMDMIFRKIIMLQKIYYKDGRLTDDGNNKNLYKDHIRFILSDINTLITRLEEEARVELGIVRES